jgi:hypothetical protein
MPNLSGSSTLMCEIYSASLTYWKTSDVLTHHPRPNPHYSRKLAAEALQEDFLSPTMSTIVASIVDLTGRPHLSIVSSAMNIARTVALAHSLGLNRDPTTWNIPEREKRLRMWIWWGILIHDRWYVPETILC